MQPTFVPWLGYFGLLQKVDLFVFLDSVQFDTRSWQQRNRINMNGKPGWITVPVTCPNGRSTLIKDVLINKEHYSRSKITTQIKQSYSRTPGFNDLSESIFSELDLPPVDLTSLNINLIKIMSERLGIDTPSIKSSELGVRGAKAELLLDICINLGATEYVSPPGSREYLEEFDGFKNHGIALEYFKFNPPIYIQNTAEFIPNLSSIDSICNVGYEKTHDLIVEGYK
jgi:hypothetical protein